MRVLVIDDSKPVRSILGRMFRDLGFEVAQTTNGQEALEHLASGPRPDVVTVNRNMPVMDGVRFIKAVRQNAQFRKLRVIMVSGESDPAKIAVARQAGVDDYLIKPLSAEVLCGALRKLGIVPMAECPPKEPEIKEASPRRPRSRSVHKVLVVDDSVVIRRTLSKVLNNDPDIEVIATAADGQIGLRTLTQVTPDVVLLDVEMPNMDGLEMLRQLRRSHRTLPVIMFSSLTERGAAATLDALMLGADDYVAKPTGVNSFNVAQQCIHDELIPRIKQLVDQRRSSGTVTPATPTAAVSKRPGQRAEVVVIGVSTGGPMALAKLLPQFLATCTVPVVIVQHMPPVFTHHLAERLASGGTFNVAEGHSGRVLHHGEAVIAPGGSHTVLERQGRRLAITLNEDPPENSCRPAADVLFRSAAAVCGPKTLAVVLTGMGKDGLSGCQAIVNAGGRVLTQDESSSVVWGMPGQVVRAGLAEEVLPLEQLGAAIALRIPKHAI